MTTKAKARPKSVEELVAFAVGHWMRIEALTIFNERTASPKEVAREIGGKFNNVAHHVKLLCESGCTEMVRMEPRGGSYEHFYRSARRPEMNDEEWRELSDEDRGEIVAMILRNLFAESLASLRNGRMHSDDRLRLSWTSLNLDEEGRHELADEQAAWLRRLSEIEERAEERMAASDENGTSTIAAVLGFARSRNGRPTSTFSWPSAGA